MKINLLFSLLLFVVHITAKGEELIVQMTTNKTVGSTIIFDVMVANPGITIYVDFGDGTKVPFINRMGSSIFISGAVAGNAIKVYGETSDLVDLYCFENNLTSLDVSNCSALKCLTCDRNNLTSLDVSNNTALTGLYFSGNSLTSLDVSNNTALIVLNCDENSLTSLDVSNNTALSGLSCSENGLTSLDVSNNSFLEYLFCSKNNLTFSSLPQEVFNSTVYGIYAPQSDILINNIVQVNTSVDLSAEREVDGNTTTFVWKKESGNNLVEGTDYTIADGVTTFLQMQQEKVYCEMKNPLFPDLTLKTTLTEVLNKTGVDEFYQDDILIFSANKTIIVDTPIKGLLSVVDLSGKVIVQKNIDPGRTEIPVVKNGVFIVTLCENGQKISKKIVVQ